jgi:microcystin-dependent protein
MASPVTPNDARGLIPAPTSDFCIAFIKVLLQLPLLFYRFINWAFDSTGNVTDDFRLQFWPAGTALESFSPTAPTGFLRADGSIVARATYPNLFTAIGTFYGAGNDDGLTFTLPNISGRALVASGTTADLDDDESANTYSLGQKFGRQGAILLMTNLPEEPPPLGDKVAGLTLKRSSSATADPANNSLDTANNDQTWRTNSNEDHADNALGDLGNGDPHENRQPSFALHVYIKY